MTLGPRPVCLVVGMAVRSHVTRPCTLAAAALLGLPSKRILAYRNASLKKGSREAALCNTAVSGMAMNSVTFPYWYILVVPACLDMTLDDYLNCSLSDIAPAIAGYQLRRRRTQHNHLSSITTVEFPRLELKYSALLATAQNTNVLSNPEFGQSQSNGVHHRVAGYEPSSAPTVTGV